MVLRIGIGLFTAQVPPGSGRAFEHEYRDTLELVRLAEALGFDSAWVSEHHGSSDGYLPSLLPMLAAFAAATTTIGLGTAVVLAPFHDPLRLAEDAAVVDQLSSGRLVLGLGVGWREEEFRMFGVPMSERGARTEELVRILRLAWTGERFSYEGRRFRYDRVKVTPPPQREGGPPILLGGYVDATFRRAGRLADGYVADADDLDEIRRALATIEEAALEEGRDAGSLRLALMRDAFVAEDGDPWPTIEPGLRWLSGTYDAWDAGDDTPERDELRPRVADEETLRASVLAGTAEEVAAALRPLVQAFADRRHLELIVRLGYPGMDLDTVARSVELFGERVIPALKGA